MLIFVNIGSGNGLSLHRWQAMTWASDAQFADALIHH